MRRLNSELHPHRPVMCQCFVDSVVGAGLLQGSRIFSFVMFSFFSPPTVHTSSNPLSIDPLLHLLFVFGSFTLHVPPRSQTQWCSWTKHRPGPHVLHLPIYSFSAFNCITVVPIILCSAHSPAVWQLWSSLSPLTIHRPNYTYSDV